VPTKRLYVGNIPFDATDDDVRRFFHPIRISDVKLIVDRETNRPRGFGFVEVEDPNHAGSALALDGAEMNGRRITVSEARAKSRPSERRKRD
jgi:RNA recognition motif-containing protein